MDPFIDEKITNNSIIQLNYILEEQYDITPVREAYGPNLNEGIIHEFCAGSSFSGDLHGSCYFAMEAYTKILILPYLLANVEIDNLYPEMVENILTSFVQDFFNLIDASLKEIIARVTMDPLELYNHKFVSLPVEQYRKYTTIFYLKSKTDNSYLGRVYTYLAIRK